jgi:V/A-type H+-transporting ATPase subunit I
MTVPREQTVYALEALSATGKVELEKDYVGRPLLDTYALRDLVNRAKSIIERHRRLLPEHRTFEPIIMTDPERQAASALAAVRHSIATHLRLERQQRQVERRIHQRQLLQQCLSAMGGAADEIVRIPENDVFLCHTVFACDKDVVLHADREIPGKIKRFAAGDHCFYDVFCLPKDQPDFRQRFRNADCEPVDIPPWLVDGWKDRDALIQEEIHRLHADEVHARKQIAALGRDPTLISAINEIVVLDWFLERTVTISEDHKHCYVTGWTTAVDPRELQRTLDRAAIDARVIFRPITPGHQPPVALADGALTGAFRPFVRMFGAPGPSEVDPTPIIAFLYPTIFGFMFADVGHGLVLVIASLLLRKAYPQTRFLLYCGLGATAFGLLFGDLFGLHLPWPAPAPCPLDDPLSIIVVSLVFGALIILLGLGLSSVEARWRGELCAWAWQEGAVLTGYISCLAALFHRSALWIGGLSLVWYFLGLRMTGERLVVGLGRLARSALELALNTLSFARIGAFAIAHTALTHTLVELTAGFDNPAIKVMVFVTGHATIILLEGLVVFIQTTRLILFEFFTRFLNADGRIFRPLTPTGFGT